MSFWGRSGFSRLVKQTADVTEASSTGNVDIPGLTMSLPRAGTYIIMAELPYTALDATSRNHGIGVTFSGTTTSLSIRVRGVGSANARQTASGTLGSVASQAQTADMMSCDGTITVSTPGTLKMSFSRSAASITHTSGTLSVREAQ